MNINVNAPILKSLHDTITAPDLSKSVHINREYPEAWRANAYTGYIEPSIEYHEDVMIIPHLSDNRAGLGEGRMENVAYSTSTESPIPVANYVRNYSEYVSLSSNEFSNYLGRVRRESFGIYAGTFVAGWGHFVLETLPRLALLSAHITRYNDAPIYFNTWKGHQSIPSKRLAIKAPYIEYFHSLGIDPKRLVFINEPILLDGMLASSVANVLSGYVNFFSLDSIRRLRLLSNEMATKGANVRTRPDSRPCIYISRRSVSNPVNGKRLVNEEEIENLFLAKGFEVLDPSLLDSEISKQILLSNARIAAGCWGSGLCNTVFSSSLEHVITLASPRQAYLPIHMQLDRACGAKSHLFIGDQLHLEKEGPDSWSIDTARLSKFLDDAFA